MSPTTIKAAMRRRDGLRTLVLAAALAPFMAAPSGAADGPASLPPAIRAQIEQEAVRLVHAKDNAFVVVADRRSGRVVQFASTRDGAVFFDFPTVIAYGNVKAPQGVTRDTCGSTPLQREAAEVEKRTLSPQEEARVSAVLSGAKADPGTVYCLQMTMDGKRYGYTVTIRGVVEDPAAVAPLVERLFVEAYGSQALDALYVETDQGGPQR